MGSRMVSHGGGEHPVPGVVKTNAQPPPPPPPPTMARARARGDPVWRCYIITAKRCTLSPEQSGGACTVWTHFPRPLVGVWSKDSANTTPKRQGPWYRGDLGFRGWWASGHGRTCPRARRSRRARARPGQVGWAGGGCGRYTWAGAAVRPAGRRAVPTPCHGASHYDQAGSPVFTKRPCTSLLAGDRFIFVIFLCLFLLSPACCDALAQVMRKCMLRCVRACARACCDVLEYAKVQ